MINNRIDGCIDYSSVLHGRKNETSATLAQKDSERTAQNSKWSGVREAYKRNTVNVIGVQWCDQMKTQIIRGHFYRMSSAVWQRQWAAVRPFYSLNWIWLLYFNAITIMMHSSVYQTTTKKKQRQRIFWFSDWCFLLFYDSHTLPLAFYLPLFLLLRWFNITLYSVWLMIYDSANASGEIVKLKLLEIIPINSSRQWQTRKKNSWAQKYDCCSKPTPNASNT